MQKFCALILLLFVGAAPAFKNQAFSFNLGGRAFIYSIDYTRLLTEDRSISIGYSYVGGSFMEQESSSTIIPVYYKHDLDRAGRKRVFISLGVNMGFRSKNYSFTVPNFAIGYRRYSREMAYFEISVLALYIISHGDKNAFLPWAGFSVGKQF